MRFKAGKQRRFKRGGKCVVQRLAQFDAYLKSKRIVRGYAF